MAIYVNLAGAAFVLAAAVLTAQMLCRRQITAVRILKETALAYSLVSSDIRVGFTSLPDAFLNVCEKTHDELTRKFFKGMYGMISGCESYSTASINEIVCACVNEAYNEILPAGDLELICEFGRIPVHMDAKMQVCYIDELVTKIKERAASNYQNSVQKCRMYNAVCIGAGIMLVIILI